MHTKSTVLSISSVCFDISHLLFLFSYTGQTLLDCQALQACLLSVFLIAVQEVHLYSKLCSEVQVHYIDTFRLAGTVIYLNETIGFIW